jgi:hypothetical protein
MLAIPAPSQAEVRVAVGVYFDSGHRYDRRYGGTFRIGYDRGYEDGYKEGVKDGRRGERYSFWDEGRYRDGDHGYRGSFGPRWEYANGYRNGFEAGYRSGFGPYGYRHRYDRRYHDRYYEDRR